MPSKTLLVLVALLLYCTGIGTGYIVFHSSDSATTTTTLKPGASDTAIALLEHPPVTKTNSAEQIACKKTAINNASFFQPLADKKDLHRSVTAAPVACVKKALRAAGALAGCTPTALNSPVAEPQATQNQSDTSDRSDMSDTGGNCYSFSDTFPSGTIAEAEICGSFLPAETPPDTRGSITLWEHTDTTKTISKTDTVKTDKTTIKKPLIAMPVAMGIGGLLTVVALFLLHVI